MKKFVPLFFSLIIATALHSQSFNPEWGQRFQHILDSVNTVNPVYGVSAAVLVPGEGIWNGVSGNARPNAPMEPAMRLAIGSNTKLFTAVMMARLQDEGILSFEDHLYDWLPSFNNVDSAVTIRQLLSHQSGIYNYTDNPVFLNLIYTDTSHFWTPGEILGYVLAPNFEKGTAWGYSNTNYLLAGMIIEAATGKTWVEELHDVILDPLDMDSTFVGAYESPNGPLASTAYFAGWVHSPTTSFFTMGGPAGSIFSTSLEMVQWYKHLFNGDIISDSALAQILNFEAGSNFGLGVWSSSDTSHSRSWYTHEGGMLGYLSKILYDTHTGSVFCLLTNYGYEPEESFRAFTDPMMHVLYNEYPKKTTDAGIQKIINPSKHLCTASFTPKLLLKNFGSDPLTSAGIHYNIDSGPPIEYSWTGYLAPEDTCAVLLEPFTPGEGLHTFTCYTSSPNGVIDEYPVNDTLSTRFSLQTIPHTLPMEEHFEDEVFPPAGWIPDPDAGIHWGRTGLTSFTGSSCAVKANYSICDDHTGFRYNLDMPVVNPYHLINPELSFLYAYSNTVGKLIYDTLRVLISSDCGESWQTLFSAGGSNLATTLPVNHPFFPTILDWSKTIVPLGSFIGHVIIRFQVICGSNNNIFLDDVMITGIPTGMNDTFDMNGILSIQPNPVSTNATFSYSLEKPGLVSLTLYNQLGNQVAVILNECQSQGWRQLQYDTSSLPVGVYYCRLQAGSRVLTGKLVKVD